MNAGTIPPVVLTGATGFLGQRVLRALARSGAPSVLAIARRATTLSKGPAWRAGWQALACDLALEPLPEGRIAPGSVVLHLAAATGKASPAEMRAVNVDGTRHVLEAARKAGASHVILVSSIAASFRDQRWYHYAHAKREAEALVVASTVPCSIVRPTMIFGPGSPIQAALTGLATGGAPIVMGSGEVQVQPIHVDDLADFLVALAADAPAGPHPIEIGGGERLSMRALLAQIREARSLPGRTPASIPLGPVRPMLAVMERVLGSALPVTAGQLASFVNDSLATPHAVVARLLPAPRAVAAMLDAAPLVSGGPMGEAPSPPVDASALAGEFALFARHFGTATVDARSVATYVRAHESLPAVPSDRFDAWLYTWGSGGAIACALADCYARRVRPFGLLRRKLVLALAVLESMPATHAEYDTARDSSAVEGWLSLAALGARFAFVTAVAVVALLPVHIALSMGGTTAPARHG